MLRDINREQQKMQSDVDNLNRHYGKLQAYLYEYIEQSVVEWSKLIVDHPKTLLLIIETTRIVDENGNSYGGGSEPIRFATLSLVSGEIWDQLLYPSYSRDVRGTEYHGLQWSDLEGKPTISEAWPKIVEVLGDRHIVVFGAEWALNALRSVRQTHLLDEAFCLHSKCKEYYNEFYELSLEKVLSYQGIEKKREELSNSLDRLAMLAQVVRNLAANTKKQEAATAASDDMLSDLDEHPF
jgi:DNA polymerase III epsilon subunit-like protein